MQSNRKYVALASATIAFAVSFAAWSLLSPLATQLQTEYHISDIQISVLIAIPVILGSIARIPMGVLTDRFGGRRVMTALLLFCVVPCLGLLSAANYTAFVIWAFVLGMAGSSFAIGIPFVSRWFGPEQQGLVAGIFGMGNIGTAVSARLAPQIAKNTGWHTVFLVFAVVLFVTAVAFYFVAQDAPLPPGPTKTMAQRLSILKENRLVWLFSLFYFVTFGCFVAFGLYLPKLLTDLYKLDKIDAGNRTAIFVVCATLARPVGGWLSDRLGASRVLTATFAVVLLAALILTFQTQVIILTSCFLIAAVFLGMGSGAVFKLVPQYFAKDAGTVTGLVGAAGGLGGFFPPLIMGAVKSTSGNYSVGYLLLALTSGVCLILLIKVLNKPQAPRQGSIQQMGSPAQSGLGVK
ncbi:MAG TPA: nitrate/nitrite transporter [Ktedonobacterales bacterium]